MKKKLSFLLGMILTLSLCLFTACGGGDDGTNLLGAYDNDDAGYSIVFHDDDTCEISSLDTWVGGTYTVDDDRLEIETDDGYTERGTYNSDEDTFTLEGVSGVFYYVEEAYYTP